MGINEMSDLTHEEFVSRHSCALQTNDLDDQDENTKVQPPTSQETETNGDTHVYSYFEKKFVNSTYEQIERKYVSGVIKNSSNRKYTRLPSRIDWRKKVRNLRFMGFKKVCVANL